MRTLYAYMAGFALLLGTMAAGGCIIDPVPLPEAESNDDRSGGFDDGGTNAPTGGRLNTSAVYFSATATPLLVVGGAGVVGSGVFYALSASSHAQFDDARTTADAEAWRARTNQQVVVAGAALAVGLGAGYVGVALAGGPGLVWAAAF